MLAVRNDELIVGNNELIVGDGGVALFGQCRREEGARRRGRSVGDSESRRSDDAEEGTVTRGTRHVQKDLGKGGEHVPRPVPEF